MKYLFLELKTTGLDPHIHTLVEIVALVEIDGFKESKCIFRLKPLSHHIIDSYALNVSGLSESDILSFGDGTSVLEDFRSFIKDFLYQDKKNRFIIVGYNASFTLEFLEHCFLDYGYRDFYDWFQEQPLDILTLVQLHCQYHKEKPNSLKKIDVIHFFGIGKNFNHFNEYKAIEQLYSLYKKVEYNLKDAGTINLDALNEAQKQGILNNEGALLVLAGAGSGKTRVIIYKMAYLIYRLGFLPEEILAVTFTNKAAKEMKERITDLIGKKYAKAIILSTFHSLGLQILKEEYNLLGYSAEFSIFSDSEREGIVKDILLELKIAEDTISSKQILGFISMQKNQLKFINHRSEASSLEEEIFVLYQEKLKQNNAFDFDDLIFKPLQLFITFPDIEQKWSKKYKYILVDEYQDTNYAQYRFMQSLSKTYGNICVVGDDDQSIYAFRGADINNILSFEKEFKNVSRIVLNYNYRNTVPILESSQYMINHNTSRHSKEILSGRKEKEFEKILLYKAKDPEDEARWIASEIFTNRVQRGVNYSQQAILCRTNMQMREIEKALRKDGISYYIIGGFSFFDKAEVKIIFAYLRLLYNSQDDQAFYRVINFPKRGVGDKTLKLLYEYAQNKKISLLKACSFASLIEGITENTAFKLNEFSNTYWNLYKEIETYSLSESVEKIYQAFSIQEELIRVYKEGSTRRLQSLVEIHMDIKRQERRFFFQKSGEKYSLGQYLQDTILSQLKDDSGTVDNQKVLLITIHSSKGLEFDCVFVPGFQEGVIPHEKSIKQDNKAIEEERRLAYVAFTRAKNYLLLSYAEYNKIESGELQTPSRFLEEVPEKYLSFIEEKEITEDEELLYLEEMKKILQHDN